MEIKLLLNSEQEILLKRNLNKNGKGQQFFTRECAKAMNPYVPFKTGVLKDINVVIGVDSINYYSPYAARQYYTNKGLGKEGTSLGGLRGKMWDRRCWSAHGKEIVKKTAEFCGGRAK